MSFTKKYLIYLAITLPLAMGAFALWGDAVEWYHVLIPALVVWLVIDGE